MAILAVVAGWNVIRRLSCRSNTVVTGAAATRHGCVIHVCDRAPGSSRMTVGTHSGCRHVIRTPGGRAHKALRGVTSDTCRAGSLEHATGVTAFAGDPDMCAIQ